MCPRSNVRSTEDVRQRLREVEKALAERVVQRYCTVCGADFLEKHAAHCAVPALLLEQTTLRGELDAAGQY